MATLPIFYSEIRVALYGPGPHEKRLKGYPEEPRTPGGHLRLKRIGHRLTQVQVAEIFGVCPLTYIKWEANHNNPSIAKWAAVVRFLGYDPIPAR
jgi:DNA-binding XRE family transcriptional regulator